MAKVSGPLMSMSASGAFAGSLVFGSWKGRPTVRQLVQPSNPHAASQETARNSTRIFGALQRFFNSTVLKRASHSDTDKAELMAATPSGYAWNGYLVQIGIGANSTGIVAARAAYAALTGEQRTAWVAAAAALTPAIPEVPQTVAGGAYGANATAGEVHFIGQYALYLAGLGAAPNGTPPVYA